MRGHCQSYRKAILSSAISCLILCQYAFGQTITNQTTLFIPQDLDVHLDGNLINEGFIQNQGNFFITGDWRNTNVYQGTGSVVLSGDLEQRFFNNKNAVFHFVVDGAGPKYINDKLPVTSRLDLVLGVVNVTDIDTLLIADGATVNGGSAESFVEGALTHDGTGYKFFPIGKNGRYYPVEMLNITGIKPVTEIEVFENTSPLSVPSPITLYSTTYWQRKNISGTFVNSPLSLGYPVPPDYTNRHVLDILQSPGIDKEFSNLGNSRVEYGNTIPMVISDNGATGNLFVLGESTPVGGIPGEFYLSTSLSPAALEPDNRYVKVFGNRLVEGGFQFRVFNRWGLLVYESNSLPNMIATGWDGKHKGESLPSGAYPYILKALNANGEVIERKGVISVIN